MVETKVGHAEMQSEISSISLKLDEINKEFNKKSSTFVSNKWKITKALNSQKIFQQTFFHKKFVDYIVKNPIVRPPSGERTTSTFSGA